MQPFIDLSKARHVWATAPTIDTMRAKLSGRHDILVETFDYGKQMGWGKDIRFRVYIDGDRISNGSETLMLYRKRREDWLPTGVTINEWNEMILALIE